MVGQMTINGSPAMQLAYSRLGGCNAIPVVGDEDS